VGDTNEQSLQDEEAPEQLEGSAEHDDDTPDVEGHRFVVGADGAQGAHGAHGAH